jgi:hypothetical protein
MAKSKKRTVSNATKKRISEAMKGNSNAEVWTEDLVVEVLNKMIDILEEDYEIELDVTEEEKETIGSPSVDEHGDVKDESKGYSKRKVKKVKRKTHLKHDLLVTLKIRDAKWFARIAKRCEEFAFDDNETVSNLLEYISKTCMSNTYNDAANGATNSTMAKMSLSTHHNWSDRVESKVKVEESVEIERPEVPEHVMKAYEKANKYIADDET